MPDYTWRPEQFLINPDGKGRGNPETDEPWDTYTIDDWVLTLDGQPAEVKERYRPLMPPEYRKIFFPDG
jgi:hypothetical protein